jgi:DnaJ family protein C protein 7
MGFQLDNCISEEAHTSEFVCAVCFQLPDISEAVVTNCAHCFCRGCLSDWFAAQGRGKEGNGDLSDTQTCACPSCKSVCRLSQVSTLKQGQPLAFRVFGKIKVRCPLHEQDCKWQGHLSEVQAHLTSSSEHISAATASTSQQNGASVADPDAAAATDLRTASALKDQANERFQARNFQDALKLYTKAIAVCPNKLPECYVNRSLTYLVLRQYANSVADAKRAVRIRPNYPKAYSRGAKALVELDRFEEAAEFLEQGIANCGGYEAFAGNGGGQKPATAPAPAAAKSPANGVDLVSELAAVRSLLHDVRRGEELSRAGQHAEARQVFSTLLQRTSAKRVMVLAANQECLAGNIERALRLTLQVLRLDPNDSGALLARATAMMYSGDIEGAQKVLKELLRQSPDDRHAQVLFREFKALKTVLNQASNSRVYYDAVAIYTVVLSEESLVEQTRAEAGIHTTTAASDAMAFFIPVSGDPQAPAAEECMRRQVGVAETVEAMSQLSLPWIPSTTPLAIQLHAERANALFRLKMYAQCLKDCAYAIYHQDDCKRAWLTKTYALIEMGLPDRAVQELEPVMERWGQSDAVIKGAYEKAVFEARKRKRVNYYEVLKVPSVASEPEIKNAYKREALVWHPDRVGKNASSSEDSKDMPTRAQAEARFKLLGEALEYLGDPVKRKLFDEGYDKAGIDERIARAERSHRH